MVVEQVRLLAHSSADPIQPDESKSVKICKEQRAAVIYRKYSFVFYNYWINLDLNVHLTDGNNIYIITRDGNMENAKLLAELVDRKLATHYQLDDSGKKKVRGLPNKGWFQDKQGRSPGSKWEFENTVLFIT